MKHLHIANVTFKLQRCNRLCNATLKYMQLSNIDAAGDMARLHNFSLNIRIYCVIVTRL